LRLHRAVPTQGLPKQDGQCNTLIETQALLTLPIVRAFAAHATTTPSADFCYAVRTPLDVLSHEYVTHSRSPAISSTAVHARPPDLPPVPLMDMGFPIVCSLARHRRPLHPVLVHRPACLLYASSRPHLAMTPLRFATLHLHQVGRGLSPPSCRTCTAYNGRTQLLFAVPLMVAGGGFEPPTFGLCDLTHLSTRVGRYLHPRGMLAIQSLRLPPPFRRLGSVLP